VEKLINVLALVPEPADATSWFRGFGPLNHLRRHEFPGLRILRAKTVDWAVIGQSDIVFMQRPASEVWAQVAQMVKEEGKPLWIDWDDDCLHVPPENPNAYQFTEAIKTAVIRTNALADVVTVSTAGLADVFGFNKKRVEVVPNAWPLCRMPWLNRPPADCILWRGGAHHARDLMEAAPQIVHALKQLQAPCYFVGFDPWFIREKAGPHCLWVPPMDIGTYHRFLAQKAPRALFVPLANTVFNQSKSAAAWLEATWAGAVTVAPAWSWEFAQEGVLRYGVDAAAQDYGELWELIVRGARGRHDLAVLQSRCALEANFTLGQTCGQRAEIILSLL
jgi:hypothetical protein